MGLVVKDLEFSRAYVTSYVIERHSYTYVGGESWDL